MTPVEQTNNSCGVQPMRFAASATVRCGRGVACRARSAVGVAGVDDDGAHAALRSAQMLLGNEHRAATTRFCVKTAAAEAGKSLETMARSSAPVFFRPQAVAAKRNPCGSDASESACFITGTSV